ncbi:radical SAM protein [bacterium]|nr:radical SAM protein [bacterium]
MDLNGFRSAGKVRACCVNFDYPLGDVSKERLDDIWNSERISRLRQALMDYDLQFGCHYCKRKLSTGTFQKEFVDAATLMTSKFERFDVEFEVPFWPKHLEFHLSNRCNLECVMCTGNYSSGIRKKREQLPPLPMVYDDQFFDDLQKYLPHLKMTQYLGGEPFIIPEMYRIWDMLIDQKLSPHCHITTNGTVWGPKVERVLESLPVAVAVSMDGITKETFEKIRINAKFERVRENLRRFRDCRAKYHYETVINFTMSRMNWHELPNMLLFAEDEGVKLHVLDLYIPESMSLYTLPLDLLSSVITTFEAAAVKLAGRFSINKSILETKIFELSHRLNQTIPTNPIEIATTVDSSFVALDTLCYQPPDVADLVEVPIDEDIAAKVAACEEVVLEPEPEPEFEPVPIPEEPTVYAWQTFRGVASAPSLEEVKARLNAWARSPHLDCIHCDQTDKVIHYVLSASSPMKGVSEFAHCNLENLIWILADRLGNEFAMIEASDDPSDFYRTVRFQSPDKGSTLVRSNFVPRRDDGGELVGIYLLIAYRPQTDSKIN